MTLFVGLNSSISFVTSYPKMHSKIIGAHFGI